VPARAPELRKLVKSALLARGYTAVITQGRRARLRPSLRHPRARGFRLAPGPATLLGRRHPEPRGAEHELLWGQPGGWDYLTEENAARSVDLLPELTDAVVRLLEM
jgi:hypothetical protein